MKKELLLMLLTGGVLSSSYAQELKIDMNEPLIQRHSYLEAFEVLSDEDKNSLIKEFILSQQERQKLGIEQKDEEVKLLKELKSNNVQDSLINKLKTKGILNEFKSKTGTICV